MTVGIFLTPVLESDSYLKMNIKLYQYLKEKNIKVIGLTEKDALSFCDGVILPGGVNYLEEELTTIEDLYNRDIPTLGICMGMQLMGIFKNGKCEIIPNKKHQTTKKHAHQVQIKKDSVLYDILKEETLTVNSRHNESLKQTDLDIVAYSNDGVIEAIEDKNKKFFVGVQWHPEDMEIKNNAILDYFISCLQK